MPFIVSYLQCRRSREAGVALVLVLWMLALLTVIAQNLAFSSRTDILVATNLAAQAQAQAYADAAVFRAAHQLANFPASNPNTLDPTRWKPDGLERLWRFGNAELRVTILGEAGKLGLNTAPPQLFVGLFLSAGLGQAEAEALADAILDWRDADDLRHPRGAERADYLAAGLRHGPANGHFIAIDELQQVIGMTQTLFRLIEPLISVHNHQAGIDTATAPRGVLLALPNAIPNEVDQFIQQRQELLEQGLPAPPFAPAQGLTGSPDGSTFSIHVRVELGDNTRFYRQAVVRLTGSSNEPVAVLAWRAPSDPARTVQIAP